MTIKDLKYVEIKCVNPLYFIFNKVNEYFEESNRNKYLILVPTNESKTRIKNREELWSKIRDLVRSITKQSDDYDDKYTKIEFNADGKLPLNRTIELPSQIKVVRVVFHENNKCIIQKISQMNVHINYE